MADYSIFREQLAFRFPTYGHALWDPRPQIPDNPIEIGDVGFIRGGKFHCLFNALRPEGEQLYVPEGYEQLVPKVRDHVTRSHLNAGHYCSTGVRVEPESPQYASGPDGPRQVSFTHSGRRGGAVLSLPVQALREDTLVRSAFGKWIVRHIDSCFAFAQALELGIERMEEIILVTGCDRTRSWTNIAFLGGEVDAQASFGVRAYGRPGTNTSIEFSPGHVMGAVVSHGLEGSNLPEDQCIFIRGFRAARTLWILRKRARAAAGPPTNQYDREPDEQHPSIPALQMYGDPLQALLFHAAEQAPDCDMVLIHDNDLQLIDRTDKGNSLESPQTDAVMDLFRRSNMEINKAYCDIPPASNDSSTDTGAISVAMFSNIFRDWNTNTVLPSHPLLHAAQSPASRQTKRQLRGEFRKWLSPPDPSINHNAACATRHAGTAKWFIDGGTFNGWKNDGINAMLWIYGNPGSGKSVLCSAIIEDIKHMRETSSVLAAYHYFDIKDASKRGLHGLLSSVLTQLGRDSDECLDALSQLYKTCDDGSEQPSDDALVRCLKEMLKVLGHRPIYIVVDALDECPNHAGSPSARTQVLGFMKDLAGWGHPNLYLCITSRPEEDIQSVLNPLTPTSHRVSLHKEADQRQDIDSYIRSFINTNASMLRWKAEDKELVINTLSKGAGGIFRWVYCQLDTLSRCFPQSIRKTLNELPIALAETYERTLQGIAREKQELAHRLFQCLVAAVRPLRVDELAELFAMEFSPNEEPKLVKGLRPEHPEEAVLSACSTLITIVEDKELKTVRFSHPSVEQFLTSDRLRTSEIGNVCHYHISPNAAHTTLAQVCLSVLLSLDESMGEANTKASPLASYSGQHWVDHAKFQGVACHVEDAMERLFDPKEPHFETWTKIYNIDNGNGPRQATPLYYAALCGFTSLAERLIVSHAEDVNVMCGHHLSPLHAASYHGHLDGVRLLIDHGADVNMTIEGRSPLSSAYDGGHLEAMRLLLESGADANVIYSTPRNLKRLLHHSSYYGKVKFLHLLLQHNADVNIRDSSKVTPLHYASSEGYVDVIQLLLDHGADVNARAMNLLTPLDAASQKGHLEVMQILLEHGADVHNRSKQNRTPFQTAKLKGHIEVAQLLLEHGAEEE